MSKTITIEGFVHTRSNYSGEPEFFFFKFDDAKSMDCVLIGPASMEYTVPEGFNRVAAEVAALEAEKARITKEFTDSIARVNDQLSKLQAITYEPEAA